MLDIKFLVTRPGDLSVSSSETDVFVGGQPLYQNGTDNGLALCKSWNAWSVLGLAVTARTVMVAGASSTSGGDPVGRGAWIHGSGSRVEIFLGTEPNSDLDPNSPYDAAQTYVVGDRLYIDDSGLVSNDTAFARVADTTTGALTGQEPLGVVMTPIPSTSANPLVIQLLRP